MRGMTALFVDLRYSLRRLAKQPGFTCVAVLVLALGIGADTAVFGITNALLLKPRPGLGDTLVGLYSRDREQPGVYQAFSYPTFADLRDRTDVFASLTAHNYALVGITEHDTTRRAFIDIVTANYFDAFGVSLALGRTFTAEEERPGANRAVAVLSYVAWKRQGGGTDVLGRTIRVNQRDVTIVGVAPAGFAGSVMILMPELFVPTGMYDALSNDFLREGQPETLADRRHHGLIVLARLQPGVTVGTAQPILDGIAANLERAYPAENKNQGLLVAPLSRVSASTSPQTDRQLTAVATVLLGMSGIVLVIASLNLANMLLASGGARRKEIAIRRALGGCRRRLVQQLLTESFVLALAGGAAGLLLAWGVLRLLGSTLLPALPFTFNFDATPDARVVAATLSFCLISTLCFGLGPAWKLARTDALPELKEHAGEWQPRRGRFRLASRDILVMGQLALSLGLLTTAGLFVRGARHAATADPGFSLDRGIVANVDSSLAGYDSRRGLRLYREALDALRRQPGVEAVSAATLMPFGEFVNSHNVQRPGAPVRPSDPNASKTLIDSIATSITSDYFQSLSLGMRRGREFTRAEEFATEGPRVAIIDEALARPLFGDADPIGRQVQVANATAGAAPNIFEVVGLAPPIRHQLFDDAPGPHIYLPMGRDFLSIAYVHVKTSAQSADAEALMLPAIRRTLQAVDPRLPVLSLETRPMYRARNLILWVIRAGAAIFTTFGLVALFMAVIGVYGVKAYIVARRTREIGIRVALGAAPRDVVWMVVREGLTTSAAGLVVGLALSALAGVGLGSLLYQGGQGPDLAVIAVAFVTLAGSALAASWLPARRATRIAPIRALRDE